MIGNLKTYIITLFLTILTLIVCSAQNNISIQQKENKVQQPEVILDEDENIINDDSLNYPVSSEDIKGMIIPNIDDTTLLRLVYGKFSYSKVDKKFFYNFSPQDWSNMQINECLGDSLTKIIYWRGDETTGGFNHSYYNETALIVNKIKNGWQIMDSYIDSGGADFYGVELKGIYNNEFLLEYTTGGYYARGIQHSRVSYSLVKRNRFTKPAIYFLMQLDKTGLDECQCDSTSYNQDKYCDKYEGDKKYSFIDSLNCFVFDYRLKKESVNCDRKKSTSKQAYQQWYMNADTSFQSKGNIITSWGEEMDDSIKSLNGIEIRQRLTKK